MVKKTGWFGEPVRHANVARDGHRRRLLKLLPQTGKRKSIKIDKKRKALSPGKRISSSGKTYWETRKNRSDKKNKRL